MCRGLPSSIKQPALASSSMHKHVSCCAPLQQLTCQKLYRMPTHHWICSGQGLSWKAGVQTYIALNHAQYNNSQACGQCLMYRGLGPGIGMLPIPSDWQYGLVDNV